MQVFIKNYLSGLKDCVDNLDIKEIEKIIEILVNARDNDNTIFVMGNGGSATTASHLCCELNKGASYNQSKRFKVICLNDSISTILAYSNDVCFEDIFVEQLKNFAKKDDVVIGISSSGNSKNVIKAIEYANEINAISVGLTGCDGGELKKIAKHSINPNYNNLQISEDIHMLVVHMIYRYILNYKI